MQQRHLIETEIEIECDEAMGKGRDEFKAKRREKGSGRR